MCDVQVYEGLLLFLHGIAGALRALPFPLQYSRLLIAATLTHGILAILLVISYIRREVRFFAARNSIVAASTVDDESVV